MLSLFVEVKKLEFSTDCNEAFPLHDGGNIIFKREILINNIVDRVLLKMHGKFKSHYWRAPVGSGKTVFLKLLGKELQNRGHDVYMTNSLEMDSYELGYFHKLAEKAGSKTVVLLIDEAQKNVNCKHWIDLLKGGKPHNLLILSVGTAKMNFDSPQFDKKYPREGDMFPVFFTADDLPELIAYFRKDQPDREDVITEICKDMLTFTAGHPFPFVKFVEHLVDDRNYSEDLENVYRYTASEKFSTSEVFNTVRERCFDAMDGFTITKAANVMLCKGDPGDKSDLEKLGLWNGDYFISPLVTSEVFLKHNDNDINVSKDKFFLDHSLKTPYAEQVIYAGLRDMGEEHFMDAHYNIVALENAVGVQWALKLRAALPNMWIAPQARTMNKEKPGPGCKPHIDFFINGRLNMGIEMALNVGMESLTEHLERFNYKYKRYGNTGVLLHFDTKNDAPLVGKWEGKIPVYTFLKKRNELFCNSTLVRPNVSRNLPSPPARAYSTRAALGCFKIALKYLK